MARKKVKKNAQKQAKSIKPEADSAKSRSIKINYDYIFLGFLLLVIILIYFIRMNFIDVPLERDEGDYGLAGKLILEGAKPYMDVFEQKPPGLFYSYAFVAAIFGTSVQGLKVGFMVINMLTVVFIGYGLRYIMSPLAAIVGAVTFAILSINPYASGYAIQAEHLLIFYVSVSFFMLCYYYKTERFLALIIAGAAVAWATTIKQNGIFFIAAMGFGVLAIHLGKQKIDFKKLLKEYLFFAIGGFGIALLVCLLMLIQGVWKEFIFWSITFPREFYISSISFERGMKYMSGMFNRISKFNTFLWYGAAAGLILVFASRLKWSIKIWIPIICALAFFSIWPGYRFYGHYWIQLFFGLSVAVGALAYTLQNFLERKLPVSLSFGLPLIVFLALSIFGFNKNKNYYLTPSPEGLMNGLYGDNPFMESRKIAEFIKRKNPDPRIDKLLVAGSEPQILLETGLKSPTPHTFMVFVASAHPASVPWRTEYLEMLRKNDYKYAVLVVHPFSWLANTEEANRFFADVYRHLTNNYKTIGVADILSKEQTIYKWDAEAENYKPQSDKYLLVLERR